MQRGIANGVLPDPYGAPILPNGQQLAYANGRTVSGAVRRPASRAHSPTELAAASGQLNGLRSGAEGLSRSSETVRAKSDSNRGHSAAEQPSQRPSVAESALPAPQQLQRPGHAFQHQLPSYAVPLANGGPPAGYAAGNGRRTPPAPRSEPDVRAYQSSQQWRGQQQQKSMPPPPPPRAYQPASQPDSSKRGGGPPRRAESGPSRSSWLASSSAPDAAAAAQGDGGRLPGVGVTAAAAAPVVRPALGGSSQSAPVSPRFGSLPAAALTAPAVTAGQPGLTVPLPQPVPLPFADGGLAVSPVPGLPPPTLQSPPPLTVPQTTGWPQALSNGPVPGKLVGGAGEAPSYA